MFTVCMLLSVPASLTNVSADQTVSEGSSIQLLCEATGQPTPNSTWNRVLKDGSNSEVLHQGPTWDFPNISRTASGTYRCTAKNGFESGLHHEICNTLYDGRFSGLLQIMGLASASECEIKLEYPDVRHSLHSLLSAVYSPRVGSSRTRRFSIMWTDTAGWPDRSKEFKVNHFVPMMKVNLQDNWVTVTRKGRTGKRPINDEKKKRSPTIHNKTGSFEPKSPHTKSGRFDYFQSDNHSSKKKISSATNTRQHTSRT